MGWQLPDALPRSPDLSSVFNWNVKQLFVFVYATHVDEQGVRARLAGRGPASPLPCSPRPRVRAPQRNHTTTIWDRIIRSPMDAELDLRDERTEYVLVDAEGRLRDKALSLHLSWDTMPYTGLLDLSSHGHADYTMPSEYVTPPPRGRGRGGGGGGSRRT